MADSDLHVDVAGYALGTLDPGERDAFERHLAGCGRCRAELTEMASTVRQLHRAAPPEHPSPSLRARTSIAVANAESDAPAAARAPRRRAWVPRLALLGLAVVAVLAAGLGGLRLGEQRQPGTVEIDTRLGSPSGEATVATARVTETPIGRVVAIESETLPGLDNDREFYELWFVGPGDGSRGANRVSAGTFHPDERGRTSVRLAAAAVPRDYPVLSLTREPRDGDPRRTGPEVLRSRAN